MVLLEAEAYGLPVVATDIGENSEVILNNNCSYIVPPGDSEALATAMVKMMALSEAERRAMGKSGLAYIEANYSLEHVVDQWEGLYKELLTKRRSV